MLTVERLREILHYDPETGEWVWLINRRGGARAGSIAGSVDVEGYRRLTVDGKVYRSARLAWLYMTGEWPSDQVDHQNLKRLDDRWPNLRPATHSQNQSNKARQANNSTGHKGVYHDRNGKFRVRIKKDGRLLSLGVFKTLEAAVNARAKALPLFHGTYANNG